MIGWWFDHPVYAVAITLTVACGAAAAALCWPVRSPR